MSGLDCTFVDGAGVVEAGQHLRQPGAAVAQLRGRRDGHQLDAVALPDLVAEPGLQLRQHAPHHADHLGRVHLCKKKMERMPGLVYGKIN